MSKSCIDLIGKMLDKDPGNRITIQRALAHSFFDQLDPDRVGESDGENSSNSSNAAGVEVAIRDEAQKPDDSPLKLQDPPQRNTSKKMGKGQPT